MRRVAASSRALEEKEGSGLRVKDCSSHLHSVRVYLDGRAGSPLKYETPIVWGDKPLGLGGGMMKPLHMAGGSLYSTPRHLVRGQLHR